MAKSTRKFKTEMTRLLEIITHSLYSHKEIFLRELISNAGDAIDKIRFEGLNDESLLEGDQDWAIELRVDKETRTLTVADNGIGMSREELIENLGTIAHSGTAAFLEKVKEQDIQQHPELIGQFGVGFYSAFMVADEITVVSRPARGEGCRWTSKGDGEYTVEEFEKEKRGTEIILHLKEEESEFLEEWRLRGLVKKFSDFLEHPIKLDGEVINSRKAIWLRAKTDITTEEYSEFYKSVAHDFEDPAETIHFIAEGSAEFKALLFIPKKRPMDLYHGEPKAKLQLYIQRVFITGECGELLPGWLRFVKGVVDAGDLPLNVSREMLQHNPMLHKIRAALVKRVLKTLEDLKTNEPERYAAFHKQFGVVLKEGLAQDWENREKIAALLLFESTAAEAGKTVTLDEVIARQPEECKEIRYLSGASREILANSPHLEGFRARGEEVLLLTDPIDEYVFPGLDYKECKFVAVNRDEAAESEAEQEKKKAAEKEFKGLLGALREKLTEVKDIRLSSRLKESAACLVQDKDALPPQMEMMMRQMGQEIPEHKRILEINPEHPAVLALRKQMESDQERAAEMARLLYDQALIAEGLEIKDPAGFARRINALLESAAG